MANRLDVPSVRRFHLPRINLESESLGRGAEAVARFSGTPQFIIYLTVFVTVWVAWNTFAPEGWQFDRAELGFTALTLMLSLQASYSAPLILLAQNRDADRDRVHVEQDRQRAERNLADTEYLTREIAGLRLALQDVATRDFVRSELHDALDDMREELAQMVREADALRAQLNAAPAADHGGASPAAPDFAPSLTLGAGPARASHSDRSQPPQPLSGNARQPGSE